MMEDVWDAARAAARAEGTPTPGVWLALIDTERCVSSVVTEDELLVAECNTAYSEADARLIAEAKGLLDLARRVAEHFDSTDAPLGETARDLIAAVEGRA